MNEYSYEVIETPWGETIILRSDGGCIPTNESNSDYQAYLADPTGTNAAQKEGINK